MLNNWMDLAKVLAMFAGMTGIAAFAARKLMDYWSEKKKEEANFKTAEITAKVIPAVSDELEEMNEKLMAKTIEMQKKLFGMDG